eukprot:2732292-Lingulodinium_polyedra.AAC.1
MAQYPSIPGVLPAEVKEAYMVVGNPGECAAIVNVSIARTVQYKNVFDANSMDFKVLRKVWEKKKKSSHRCE